MTMLKQSISTEENYIGEDKCEEIIRIVLQGKEGVERAHGEQKRGYNTRLTAWLEDAKNRE